MSAADEAIWNNAGLFTSTDELTRRTNYSLSPSFSAHLTTHSEPTTSSYYPRSSSSFTSPIPSFTPPLYPLPPSPRLYPLAPFPPGAHPSLSLLLLTVLLILLLDETPYLLHEALKPVRLFVSILTPLELHISLTLFLPGVRNLLQDHGSLKKPRRN
jgi:hypothetical protein